MGEEEVGECFEGGLFCLDSTFAPDEFQFVCVGGAVGSEMSLLEVRDGGLQLFPAGGTVGE